MDLPTLRKSVNVAVAAVTAARLERKAAHSANIEAIDSLAEAEGCQKILQAVAQTIQEQVHNRIAAVVSRCLTAVFSEPYAFRITFEQKRGRTEARLSFVRGGIEVDPLTAAGGGVVDVAAFALRLAALMLSRPVKRRLLVLDEPFRFVSAEYRPKVRELLAELATEMGVQFVLVTHMPELYGDKVVEL